MGIKWINNKINRGIQKYNRNISFKLNCNICVLRTCFFSQLQFSCCTFALLVNNVRFTGIATDCCYNKLISHVWYKIKYFLILCYVSFLLVWVSWHLSLSAPCLTQENTAHSRSAQSGSVPHSPVPPALYTEITTEFWAAGINFSI